mmetsp:Transcript_18363/g.38214  ORF Transcript_18363/g.38214 Transcript_18363/m.38214 type:complete len:384 (+) Transcript_18363:23-1174(+)
MVLSDIVRRATGVLAIVFSGVFISANTFISRLLLEADWPYFRLMGTGSLCISACILVGVLATQGWDGLSCKQNEIKWVIGRGICGTGQFLFAVLAAAAGASLGDIGALSSINTVVAALLGRLFLGERLGPWHAGAMLFSIAGAVLISDPAKMGSQGKPFAWLGYFLALMSGISFGLMFICSRKSGSASSWLLSVSAMGQRGNICWILAGTPAVDDHSFNRVAADPWLALALVVLLIVVTFLGNFLSTVGAKRCPAAVSATWMTAVSMGVGYAAQTLIFKQVPTALTLAGAFMMFLAVVTMAIARLPPRQRTRETSSGPPPDLSSSAAASPSSESRSLASFVASEYAERQPPEAVEEFMPEMHRASDLRPRPVSVGAAAAFRDP